MTNNFDKIKDGLIDFSKTLQDFEKVFIVRNIFSRFAIYLLSDKVEKGNVNFPEKYAEYIDTVEVINDKDDYFVVQDLLKSSVVISGNVFFSERHIENTNWFIQESLKLKTPVTSFYSFKGGVGRTTATILTALILARQGKKVMVIDFDLEAPGLASIFANQSDNSEELLGVNGFVDFLLDFEFYKRDFSKLNLDNYYFIKNDQALVGSNGGELIIIPAISTDSASSNSYINKLSKANIRYGFGKDYVPDLFLKKMEEKINPDFILIDTRTGINDVGGLVFNRYAQNIFLLFYGNQQNMFGLESILPELKNLNKKDVKFYLVNSPVPSDENLAKEETDYYVEKSYEIFVKHYYEEDQYPSQFDQTADHYPINIPYNSQALLLNSNRKLSSLIELGNNPYLEIANIISADSNVEITETNKIGNRDAILKSIVNIENGVSEVEFKNEDDLKRLFYPRKDYKYIFEKEKFLILGEKGVGKTALFSVLSHQKYAEALARYCEINTEEIANTRWIIGLEKDGIDFPHKTNFESLNDFSLPEYRNYWIILLIRTLAEEILPKSDIITEIKTSSVINLKSIAAKDNIGEQLMEVLFQVNNELSQTEQFVIVVYDHLDSVLPVENGIRGKLVSALLSFYYENINRFSNLKSKIFLRNDIFTREVIDVTDKVKIQNYSQRIEWEYNQLLNVIWKRIYEQDKNSALFKDVHFDYDEILGSIPKLTEEKEHKILLDRIFGKNMGGNNKAYPYNWIKSHIEDTNNKIHPRTLIKLFAESAMLEKDAKDAPKDRIIRSKNIEKALESKVSQAQVQELKEEYPELSNVLNDLYNKIPNGRTPINEKDLEIALKDLNEEPILMIEKLKDIGVLKDYKPYSKTRTGSDERRYHIPDLYLYGLKFTRKGTR